jgi:cysteine-rich repeat protein
VWVNNEACDDGNLQNADGCEDTCVESLGAVKVTTGSAHTCVLFWDGQVKCWGFAAQGQLGYGNMIEIGNDETPASVGFLDLGGTAVDIDAGDNHTCALMDDASVVCWGYNESGRLGYGHTSDVGDDETPSSVGPVDIGDDVVALELGGEHTCVLTDQQTVRCWGDSIRGQLGQGNTLDIGDDELPSSIGPISLGGDVVDLATAYSHSCVVLVDGGVRCWGNNNFGTLGLPNAGHVGDDELPSAVSLVSLGNTPVVAISSGYAHTCVLYEDGTIRCWGQASYGELGYGNTNRIGDNEVPSSVGPVDVGGSVDELFTGVWSTCVRMGADVKCWGQGNQGKTGYATEQNLGDDEVPASYGFVDLGFAVTGTSGSTLGYHVCVLSGPQLRCWGYGGYGELGHGNTLDIGDDETPASVGNVPYY